MPLTETKQLSLGGSGRPSPSPGCLGDEMGPGRLRGLSQHLRADYCLDGSFEYGNPKVAQTEMAGKECSKGLLNHQAFGNNVKPLDVRYCGNGYGRPTTASGPAPRSAWRRSWGRLCPFSCPGQCHSSTGWLHLQPRRWPAGLKHKALHMTPSDPKPLSTAFCFNSCFGELQQR